MCTELVNLWCVFCSGMYRVSKFVVCFCMGMYRVSKFVVCILYGCVSQCLFSIQTNNNIHTFLNMNTKWAGKEVILLI